MTQGRDIICFSSNDWSDIPSSKLHIMRYLGRNNRVLYIETLGIRSPHLSKRDFGRAIQKLKLFKRGMVSAENNVQVWSPLAIPFHGLPGSAWLNARLVTAGLRRNVSRLGMRNPILWSYLPNAIPIISRLGWSPVVYHCIDDYGEFTDAPKEAFERMERAMLARADLTVVSSKKLFEKRKPHARRIRYIPHGVNLREFQEALKLHVPLPDIDSIPGPIAGFIGRIADWIDLDLVARCARQMSDWSFVLVGPSNVDLESYRAIPNIHFLGRRDHKLIPHYIQRFNVSLMPFGESSLVDSVNPLKMYEYLAVGRPVVTVRMPEVEAFARVVTIAPRSEFAEAIRRASEQDSPEARQARVDAMATRSWDRIAEEILEDLESNRARAAAR